MPETRPHCQRDDEYRLTMPEPMPERHVALPPGLTVAELQQRAPRVNGLTLAAAIVAGIALGVLLAHSAARAGWLS